MTYAPLDRLKKKSAKREIVVIAGTGVSAATVTNPALPTTWPRLLDDGIDFCLARTVPPDPQWESRVRDALAAGELMTAAHMIDERLCPQGPSSRLRRMWLQESVGTLRADPFDPADPSTHASRLVNTIWELKAPVLTTNYDTLIRQVINAEIATWMNPDAFRRAALGELPRTVGHLHGVWMDTESVILDPFDYGRLSTHKPTAAALEQVAYGPSILFVGVGGGIADPTFGALRRWLQTTVEWSTNAHYLLVADTELAQARDELRNDPIEPIGFGGHGDLEPFIRTEIPAPP